MTKLIIQIPCYNEEECLGVTLTALPREIPGIDIIEWLIINDGSQDRTVEIAKEYKVDHIISFPRNQGLAKAFMAGLEASLKAGADIIINTDADNQYCADDIPYLIQPIILRQAEIVVGQRPIWETKHFSYTKKLLQQLGSWVVRIASNTNIPDAPSGFRAFSREAAMQLNVFNSYTYTLETIIQAGQKGITITSIPIRTNSVLRPSRLVRSTPSYVLRSLFTILRIFLLYKPLRFFLMLGSLPLSLGVISGIRWLFFFFSGYEKTRVPTLILATILVLVGFQLWILGLIADLMAANRIIMEEIQVRMRRQDCNNNNYKK
ncbi:glycosyl transferase, family 2 [Trichodesmium erythraeum IMS101]|uniref:Glycosyl transferase, family 2 n=1 Tax=Trichodesmium erythraeum (strain IMS101) TaxID=203124 RepID=Q10YJ2_TRIEI|nr:glycosyltransferase family 2 protein [Trichodesmium erythraeum GBRTRLIN201]MCH2051121.1 glycosyltransferase family 2 protein [Trichodesmium sp. ALOHA_ZT_67]MDE5093581.1 glycosyltransferase family 2 protein [Trichodesmium sp. St11_bin5]